MGVTLFFLQKIWRPFLVIASEEAFLAVVSSPLPSSHVVYPLFLNSATKISFMSGVTPLEGVTRGGPLPTPTLSPSDATGYDCC